MLDISRYEGATFPVKEVPVPNPVFGDEPEDIVLDGAESRFKMIVREDTLEPISIMSKDYRLVTNQELLSQSLPLIEQYGGVVALPNQHDAEEVFNNFSNARFQFGFDFPQVEVKIGQDTVYPRLTLMNSYDGTKRVGFKYGAYRLVCSNGLTIGKASTEMYMHIGKDTPLNDISRIVDTVFEKLTDTVENGFSPLTEKKMKLEDIEKFIKLFPKRYQDEVVKQINSKIAWDIYNAGTYVTSQVMKRENEATHKLEGDIYRFVASAKALV